MLEWNVTLADRAEMTLLNSENAVLHKFQWHLRG
jgi:hypothetical protein